MNDTTIIYYTANYAPEAFLEHIRVQILRAAEELPIVSVSQKPLSGFGKNILVPEGRSHVNIYRQALIGAKAAETQYIALAEDDTLYSRDHFMHIPSPGKFCYNKNVWSLYTWAPDLYSYKDRRTMNNLICERDLFIEAMEERFAKYPDESQIDISLWSEPGKYERQLGVTVRETEMFTSEIPNVVFSHEKALAFNHLGRRKRMGYLKAYDIPHWGRASTIAKLYG